MHKYYRYIAFFAGTIIFTGSITTAAPEVERNVVIGTGFAYGNGYYHLFYDTLSSAPRGGYCVAYAYSKDGLHWVKPVIGLVKDKGSTQNNLLNYPTGSDGAWNETAMSSGGAMYEPGKWRFWVAGYHHDNKGVLHSQLTLFEGSDLKNLKLVVDKPVVPNGPQGTFDYGFTRVPCIINEGGKFRMYYTAGDGKGIWLIGYAESTDGVVWTKPNLGIYEYAGSRKNNIVLGLDSNRGEYEEISHPWVFKDGKIYRMYYSIQIAGGQNAIGLATSPDGIHWTKNSQTAVLKNGPKGSFDYWYAVTPKVIKEGNVYRMWYTGYDGGAPAQASGSYAIGYAESSDGINWKKYDGNPVFDGKAKCIVQPSESMIIIDDRDLHITFGGGTRGNLESSYNGNYTIFSKLASKKWADYDLWVLHQDHMTFMQPGLCSKTELFRSIINIMMETVWCH